MISESIPFEKDYGVYCLLGQSFDRWQAWRADDRRFGRFIDQCES
jgi:hypothetical protein